MAKSNLIVVLYLGPSMIDGTEIVALATLESRNVKTGPMIQTWIVPAGGPLDASKRGADGAVCGDCPRRRSLGGDCYVRIDAAPHSAWKRWDREGRPGPNWTDERQILAIQQAGLTHGLRLGSYGDPAAVPADVWRDLIDATRPRVVTGYTHQWRRAHAADLRGMIMASCDSIADARAAIAAGWRYFVALPNAPVSGDLPGRTVQCLADARGLRCEECGICDGARAGRERQPASVWIAEHGPLSSAKIRRAAGLVVLAA